MLTAEKAHPIRPAVHCGCKHVVFDGLVIKSRVVRVLPKGAEAKCKRCGQWVSVPVTYSS
jgi:DNA replicative helicase MCM subunit Mcm2 (Cdc46/Mcm family)